MDEFYRIKRLPPYVFAIVNDLKSKARARGEDIIDLGMGNPDQETPKHIVDKLVEAARNPRNHRYSASKGITRLRKAVTTWYRTRYGVELDPETEAIATIGAKEGMAHLALAVLQPGDVLVGHSGGGYDVTLAADAVPDKVHHVVYLAAGLPLEGRTVLEATGGAQAQDGAAAGEVTRLMDDETGMSRLVRPDERGRMVCGDAEAVREFFYHDCDAETAAWAFARLTPAPVDFLTEIVSVPRFWAAGLPRSYILCTQDKAKPHAMSLEVVHRLGVTPLTIDSSHSPFLSQPALLARLVVQATATVPVGPLRPGR